MSQRVDKFCDNLRERLNGIESRLHAVKTNFQDLPAKTDKAVREMVDQARTKLQAQKERIDTARGELKVRAEQKLAETKEAINEWKAKREVRKLNARAERAEAYANAAMVLAMASIDEAEDAVLEAVAARMDADAAQ